MRTSAAVVALALIARSASVIASPIIPQRDLEGGSRDDPAHVVTRDTINEFRSGSTGRRPPPRLPKQKTQQPKPTSTRKSKPSSTSKSKFPATSKSKPSSTSKVKATTTSKPKSTSTSKPFKPISTSSKPPKITSASKSSKPTSLSEASNPTSLHDRPTPAPSSGLFNTTSAPVATSTSSTTTTFTAITTATIAPGSTDGGFLSRLGGTLHSIVPFLRDGNGHGPTASSTEGPLPKATLAGGVNLDPPTTEPDEPEDEEPHPTDSENEPNVGPTDPAGEEPVGSLEQTSTATQSTEGPIATEVEPDTYSTRERITPTDDADLPTSTPTDPAGEPDDTTSLQAQHSALPILKAVPGLKKLSTTSGFKRRRDMSRIVYRGHDLELVKAMSAKREENNLD